MLLIKTHHSTKILVYHIYLLQQREASFEFRVIVDTPIVDLKLELENILNYLDNQRMVKIKYRSS